MGGHLADICLRIRNWVRVYLVGPAREAGWMAMRRFAGDPHALRAIDGLATRSQKAAETASDVEIRYRAHPALDRRDKARSIIRLRISTRLDAASDRCASAYGAVFRQRIAHADGLGSS
ncbi:hypothetical protein C7S16_1290 [Burkholderia thailandensis]|uniref:Uncharacterized protein n=1 Tax=Burkholderia thailandensis TaxID=57975 RepID=A0AAW9D6S6_BURTH|nr:hypothetical protein [Burkholderia thailandensis]MDW9257718.1 hypothetical protein [Burkholderia thailandensis]